MDKQQLERPKQPVFRQRHPDTRRELPSFGRVDGAGCVVFGSRGKASSFADARGVFRLHVLLAAGELGELLRRQRSMELQRLDARFGLRCHHPDSHRKLRCERRQRVPDSIGHLRSFRWYDGPRCLMFGLGSQAGELTKLHPHERLFVRNAAELKPGRDPDRYLRV